MMSRCSVLLVAMCCALCAGAWSAETEHVICAVGQGVAQVLPDQVCVDISVRSENKEMVAARQQAAEKMTTILQAVKAMNIKNMVISTETFQVQPMFKPMSRDMEQYAAGGEVARERTGYSVINSVSIEISGGPSEVMPALSRVIDAAAKRGATTIGNPQYVKVDMAPTNREALEEATRDAKENAQAIARGLGVVITGYRYAGMAPEPGTESHSFDSFSWTSLGGAKPPPPPGGPGGGEETMTPLETKTIAISTVVYVTATY